MNQIPHGRMRPYIQRNFSARGYDLFVIWSTSDGRTLAISDIEVEDVSPAENIPDRPITFTEEAAQQLMDELYAAGLRPTDGAGSAGAMSRAEAHIKDLQKIAFKLLEIE